MAQFLSSDEDIQWLKDTHLRGVPLPAKYADFKFVTLFGNEDAPYALHLYVSQEPNHDDDYLHFKFHHEPPVYCSYIEIDGKTEAPKRVEVRREG